MLGVEVAEGKVGAGPLFPAYTGRQARLNAEIQLEGRWMSFGSVKAGSSALDVTDCPEVINRYTAGSAANPWPM